MSLHYLNVVILEDIWWNGEMPAINKNLIGKISEEALDEYENLKIGYGNKADAFSYASINNYRDIEKMTEDWLMITNEMNLPPVLLMSQCEAGGSRIIVVFSGKRLKTVNVISGEADEEYEYIQNELKKQKEVVK